MSIPVSFWTPKADDSGLVQINDNKISYSIRIPYDEFREYLVETDGAWGDDYFHSVFDKYVEDDYIEIDYRYGPCVNWKTEIIWKVSDDDTKKAYKIRYGHSSLFAMWWCSLTDENED